MRRLIHYKLQNKTGKVMKSFIIESNDRLTRRLRIGNRRKSSVSIEGEMMQSNAMLSERTVRRRLQIFG